MTTSSLATKRAVGYLRVSTPGQTGEHHSSLETQEARFLEFCQAQDLTPLQTFIDVVSGRRDDRKEYNRMVEFVLEGGADVVVVQYLDRFGRNPREILQRYWQLQDHDVTIEAADEDIKEELLLLLKAGIAGAESRRTSERVRANMSRAVQKGVHAGRAPYGLKRVYEGKLVKWELEPLEASAVRDMYRLSVDENLGYKSIADRLNTMGYAARGGQPFASYTIQRILGNEALIGTLAYGKRPRKGNPNQEIVRVPDFFPTMLSKQEWNTLQDRLAIRREHSRGSTHTSVYLLSGIVRCGNCRGTMVGKVGAKRKSGGRYRNYWCHRALTSRAKCSTYNGHSAPKLEQEVIEYLGQFSDPELVKKYIATAEQKELKKSKRQLKELDRGLRGLETQFLKHLDLVSRDLLNDEEFTKANQSIRNQRSALEVRRDELHDWIQEQEDRAATSERIPADIRTFLEDFQTMEPRVQKAHLQTILKSAYVFRDNRIELEFR